jgi:dimethylhistidine N-methyltransferase
LAQFLQCTQQDEQEIRRELITGLLAPNAYTSPKYLYDALGSKLFEAICELPEYYPTRTELQILEQHAAAIAQSVGIGSTLIDLGAGNCAKAERLFPILQPAQYVPIDISVDFLHAAVGRLQQQFAQIDMVAIGMDFSSTLVLPEVVRGNKRLFFYPGSSIGNFAPAQAIAFLQEARKACEVNAHVDGGILIGVDLVKDHALLHAAYDDALGVTASFNLNLLNHLNHLIDADFNVRDWQHHGFFNPESSRIEMHLEAKSNLTVRWQGGQRRFERGERIHTESSYKYTQAGFIKLLEQAGFREARVWTDPRGWFMVCHAQAV